MTQQQMQYAYWQRMRQQSLLNGYYMNGNGGMRNSVGFGEDEEQKKYPVSYDFQNLSVYSWPNVSGKYESSRFWNLTKTEDAQVIGTATNGIRYLENGQNDMSCSNIHYVVGPKSSNLSIPEVEFWKIDKFHCIEKKDDVIVAVQTMFDSSKITVKGQINKFDPAQIAHYIAEIQPQKTSLNYIGSHLGIYYSIDGGENFLSSYQFKDYTYVRRVVSVGGKFIVPILHNYNSEYGNNVDYLYSSDGQQWTEGHVKSLSTQWGSTYGMIEAVKVSENQCLLLPHFNNDSYTAYLLTIDGEGISTKPISTDAGTELSTFRTLGSILVARYYDTETKNLIMYTPNGNNKLVVGYFDPQKTLSVHFDNKTQGLMECVEKYYGDGKKITSRAYSISKHFNTYYICFAKDTNLLSTSNVFSTEDFVEFKHVLSSNLDGITDMYSEGNKLYMLSEWGGDKTLPKGGETTGLWDTHVELKPKQMTI